MDPRSGEREAAGVIPPERNAEARLNTRIGPEARRLQSSNPSNPGTIPRIDVEVPIDAPWGRSTFHAATGGECQFGRLVVEYAE